MPPVFDVPDLKTLRLATPPPSATELEKLLTYQQAFVEARKRGDDVASAHAVALQSSNLAADSQARLSALVADYAGRAWTRQQLTERNATLLAKKDSGELLSSKEMALLLRLSTELANPSARELMRGRYGDAWLALLDDREPDIVRHHQAYWALAQP